MEFGLGGVAVFSDSGPVLLDAGEVRFDFGNSFPYEGAPQRLFKIVTAKEDADATDPEVFSGPATKTSLEKPIHPPALLRLGPLS